MCYFVFLIAAKLSPALQLTTDISTVSHEAKKKKKDKKKKTQKKSFKHLLVRMLRVITDMAGSRQVPNVVPQRLFSGAVGLLISAH